MKVLVGAFHQEYILCDYEPSDGPSFEALVAMKYATDWDRFNFQLQLSTCPRLTCVEMSPGPKLGKVSSVVLALAESI